MKKRMRILASAILTVCLLMTMVPMSAMAAGDTTVAIADANVLIHGRSYTAGGELKFDWTNSGISFTVNGTGAKATMTCSQMSPNPVYVNVYVDDDVISRNTILMGATREERVLVEGLPAGNHTITLRKRNEAVYGGSATWGIVDLTAIGGTFGAAPADVSRHIEVIGDSITAGFGNLDVGSVLGYNSHTSDGTSTYATMTAAAFGADIDVIARSGIRFVRQDESGSMYPVYEQISGLNGKCTDPYDFAAHPKDVVIINLGTNDAGVGTNEYTQSEAKAFVELIRKNNPDSLIVWAYGIMGNGKTDAIQAGIKEVVDAGDDKLFFFPLDRINSALENVGTGNHPTITTSINRSFDLTEFIASKLGWDYDYDTQLAQMLRIAEDYSGDYLSAYTNESIQTLNDAIADAQALTRDASNADIKAAVAAIQLANKNLELALDEAVVLGAEEKTATSHFMRVDYLLDEPVDPENWEGRPLYLQFQLKAQTTNQPANATWARYVQNGRVWFGHDFNNRITDGLNLGGADVASPTAKETDWMTVTIELKPEQIPESITEVGFYLYNDTGNMGEIDKGGVAWDNNSGVTLHVQNVRLLTTNLDVVVKSVLKTRLDTRKSAGNLLAYTDESVAEYNALFDAAQAIYDKEDATQDEVNAASKSIKNADAVLELKDKDTVAIFFMEETTAPESHYLSIGSNLEQPLDLKALSGEELALVFDIKFDTTASFQGDPASPEWLPLIRNGLISLYNGANQGFEVAPAHAGSGVFAGAQPGEWLPVRITLSRELLKQANISRFFMYIYNDTAGAGNNNESGVTFSIRDLHIVKTGNQIELDPKEDLNKAIASVEKLPNLSVYTAASVANLNTALNAAKAVSADEAATKEAIDAATAALKAAYDALELDPANIVAIFSRDTLTSGEAHYLSIAQGLPEMLDLSTYNVGDLFLTFDIMINTTEKHPDPDNEAWLPMIRNGQIRLFSVPTAQATNDNGIPTGGTGAMNQIHCKMGVLEDIEANEWLTVTAPLPEQLYTDGQVGHFHMFIYNDMGNLGAGWSNDNGVTLSVRNLRIVKNDGGTEPQPTEADKTALQAAITAAEAALADGKTYTADSVAAVNTALTAANGVNADTAATQSAVDAAVAALNDAVAGLTEDVPVVVDIPYGDVDGQEGVTAADALMALQAATGKVDLNDEQKAAADVDGDGDVTAADALMILQKATDKIDSFPVELA